MSGVVGMLWNGEGLGTGESNVSIVLLNSVLHRFSSLSDVHLATFTENPVNYAIPRFTDWGWCESYAKYWSVCVGFLYTLVVRRPSGSLKTAVSRKASLLSFSVSMVKWMEGCCLFRCCKKSSTFSWSRMVKVSSTSRFQILGSFNWRCTKSYGVSQHFTWGSHSHWNL